MGTARSPRRKGALGFPQVPDAAQVAIAVGTLRPERRRRGRAPRAPGGAPGRAGRRRGPSTRLLRSRGAWSPHPHTKEVVERREVPSVSPGPVAVLAESRVCPTAVAGAKAIASEAWPGPSSAVEEAGSGGLKP